MSAAMTLFFFFFIIATFFADAADIYAYQSRPLPLRCCRMPRHAALRRLMISAITPLIEGYTHDALRQFRRYFATLMLPLPLLIGFSPCRYFQLRYHTALLR